MLVTTLILPLLIAAPADCYLVTNEAIQPIPCDFRAAATDALRYRTPRPAPEPQRAAPEPPTAASPPPVRPEPVARPTFGQPSPEAGDRYEAEKRRFEEARAAAAAAPPRKAFPRGRRNGAAED